MYWKENWCPYITYMSNYFCDAPWWEWWWMMITVTVGSDDLLCSPVIDLQHQRVYWRQDQSQMSAHSMCEQQRAREVRGRTRAGWRGRGEQLNPPTDHTTVDRQDTILKITASLQWIQIISDRLNTANVLMPKLACTRQISVFPRDLGQSSQRVQQGEDVDAAMARGLSSFDRNICTEVSMRSVLPNKKSAGILFCVTLTAAGVGGAAWPSQQYTHVTVDLVNTDP